MSEQSDEGAMEIIETVENGEHVESSETTNKDEEDAEDGEILEDGEIDDDGVDDVPLEENLIQPAAVEAAVVDKSGSRSRSSSESEAEGESKRRKKRKRKHKKEKKKREDKQKRKRRKYVDHDRVEDDLQESWPSTSSNKSPYKDPRETRDPYDSPYKSPPGLYDSPYDSPPGPYDSPYDSMDEGNEHASMYSLMDDGYIDMNVAASEKHEMFDRKQGGPRGSRGGKSQMSRRKLEKRRRYLDNKRQQAESHRPQCKFYLDGKCQKGNDCGFSHAGQPSKKPELCKYYLNGYCSKATDCPFYHNDFPCKFFHMGNKCSHGNDCRFSHDPLTEQTKQLLQSAIKDKDELNSSGRKNRPSLLGDAPAHMLEAIQKQKAIPSLFDIDVEEPKELESDSETGGTAPVSPTKQSSGAPPAGFYKEASQGQQSPPANPSPNRPALLPTPTMPLRGPHPGPPAGMVPGMVPGMRPPPPMMGRPPMPGMHPPPPIRHAGPMGVPGGPMGLPPPGVMAQNFYTNFFNSQQPQGVDGMGNPVAADVEQGAEQQGDLDGVKKAEFDIPAGLAPKQRELLLRIQKQQREATPAVSSTTDAAETENWYSSDEEEEQASGKSQNSLMDILKNIAQQPTVPKPTAISSSTGLQPPPVFNITQMLTSIKSQGSTTKVDPRLTQSSPNIVKQDPRLPDPRLQSAQTRVADPRLAKAVEKPAAQPVVTSSSSDMDEPALVIEESPASPEGPKSPEPEKILVYKLREIYVAPRTFALPANYQSEARFKKDPRIQKYLSLQGNIKSPPPLSPSIQKQMSFQRQSSSGSPAMSPRLDNQRTDSKLSGSEPADVRKRPVDPRVKPSDPRPQDPLLAGFTVPKPPDLEKPSLSKSVTSALDITSNKTVNGSEQKTVNYRNDPRFKRKSKALTISQPASNFPVNLSDSSHQSGGDSKAAMLRKTNMDYTSPLQSPPAVAPSEGYDRQKRPGSKPSGDKLQIKDPRKAMLNSQNVDPKPTGFTDPRHVAKMDIDGSRSPQVPNPDQYGDGNPGDHVILSVPPEGSQTANLKEMFKSFDPTASPFC